MSDYHCPECGCGFPESVGKKYIKDAGTSDDVDEFVDNRNESWIVKKWREMKSSVNSGIFRAIECPNCGYIIWENHFNAIEDIEIKDTNSMERGRRPKRDVTVADLESD